MEEEEEDNKGVDLPNQSCLCTKHARTPRPLDQQPALSC